MNVMRQTTCLVVNPITVDIFAYFAALFNCTTVGQASDSIMKMLCLWSVSPGFNCAPAFQYCFCCRVLILFHLSVDSSFICLLFWCVYELEVLNANRITCMFINHSRTYGEGWSSVKPVFKGTPPPPRVIYHWPFKAVLLLLNILLVIVHQLSVCVRLLVRFAYDRLVAICWESAVLLAVLLYSVLINCLCSFLVWWQGQNVEFDFIGSWPNKQNKNRRAHCMAGVARHLKMCAPVFSFIPQGNENNQLSILII